MEVIMKNFEYVIKDELGIHARPAGLIVKEASKFSSSIIIQKGDKSSDAKRLFALMSLGARNADTISVSIDGEDEEAAYEEMKQLFEANL
jgi:phosphocarrier protein HPr